MKLKRNITSYGDRSVFRKTCLAVLLVLAIFLCTVDGIRVYEGTNFAAPKLKLYKGLSKKSTYISKRSWAPPQEGLKVNSKMEKRSEGKWKDLYKTKSVHNHFPSLYKIVFKGKDSMEYIKYNKQVPRLKEYTFCLWYKPNQLSRDQTLFSYALNKNEKLLRFWFNVLDSTLQMAIRDNVAFKVPVNIRRNRWYHICQSWHGVLGEWQVFLDGKRIGAGVLPLYKETYIPEGGEVILSDEPANEDEKLKMGLDGDVFGFNLVDEAVPGEQGNFINSQYKPTVRGGFVPPFKKLPPMKKTYQEIKAYISKLPNQPAELANGIIDSKAHPGQERGGVKRIRESVTQMKRPKGSSKSRRPSMRKVIIYNREDRKLQLNENSTETDATKVKAASEGVQSTTLPNQRQPYDENYSIHSYRMGKNVRKSSNYEIYESQEDDLPVSRSQASQENSSERRKERQNFDIHTAREANRVYTLSNSVRDAKKPKFHFETGPAPTNQESSTSAETAKASQGRTPLAVRVSKAERRISESIPVYEAENSSSGRQKRDAENIDEQLADGFRRLPQIPDTLINILTKNATKTEIEQTLNHYFGENSTRESLELSPSVRLESKMDTLNAAHSSLPTRTATEDRLLEKAFRANAAPVVYQVPVRVMPQATPSPLVETMPVNFPATPEEVQEFDSRKRVEKTSADWYATVEVLSEDRRKFDVTSGTDLIMRSYGLCTGDRGSPIKSKQHLVISWAETPIRIFGGAEIEPARNECGNF